MKELAPVSGGAPVAINAGRPVIKVAPRFTKSVVITEPLRKLIMQKRDGGELKQCAIAEGMETLRQDGWRRVAQGKTTIEEVVRVTQTDEVMAETTDRGRAGRGGRIVRNALSAVDRLACHSPRNSRIALA